MNIAPGGALQNQLYAPGGHIKHEQTPGRVSGRTIAQKSGDRYTLPVGGYRGQWVGARKRSRCTGQHAIDDADLFALRAIKVHPLECESAALRGFCLIGEVEENVACRCDRRRRGAQLRSICGADRQHVSGTLTSFEQDMTLHVIDLRRWPLL